MASSSHNPPSVLVVDDLPDAAESLATLLAIHGFPVRTASSGEDALALAAAEFPDVVFTDLGMPGMSGFELARRLREQASGKKLVVVALTGYATEEDRRKSAAAGIDLHLAKPAAPELLLELLGRVRRGEPLPPPGQS